MKYTTQSKTRSTKNVAKQLPFFGIKHRLSSELMEAANAMWLARVDLQPTSPVYRPVYEDESDEDRPTSPVYRPVYEDESDEDGSTSPVYRPVYEDESDEDGPTSPVYRPASPGYCSE